jgi:hypothetical protein
MGRRDASRQGAKELSLVICRTERGPATWLRTCAEIAPGRSPGLHTCAKRDRHAYVAAGKHGVSPCETVEQSTVSSHARAWPRRQPPGLRNDLSAAKHAHDCELLKSFHAKP